MRTQKKNLKLRQQQERLRREFTRNDSLFTQYFVAIYTYFFRYPTPLNLTTSWNFGFLSFVFLVIQIASGFFLSMHYIAEIDKAADSIITIQRSVDYGWLFRYMHMNGATFFFFFVYCHMFRSLFYNSYLFSKKYVWLVGVIIYFLMIFTAFTGYVLPWGSMGYWAATVITSLTTSIPIIGYEISEWVWGDYKVSSALLNRFFSLHFFLPFIILGLVIFHVILLHIRGSRNKIGNFVSTDKAKFAVFFIIKDMISLVLALMAFAFVIGAYPRYFAHFDNFAIVKYLSTPEHIEPEWYFLVYYAMLRSVPDKLVGVIILGLAIVILAIFPFFIKKKNILRFVKNKDLAVQKYWDDIAKAKKNKEVFERSWQTELKYYLWQNRLIILFWLFVDVIFLLGYIGAQPIEKPFDMLGGLLTVAYFLYFFLVILFFKESIIERSWIEEVARSSNTVDYSTWVKNEQKKDTQKKIFYKKLRFFASSVFKSLGFIKK